MDLQELSRGRFGCAAFTLARTTFAALALGALAAAQTPAAATPGWAPQVDALFARWDKPDSPGCALGVIQDGKLVYARGYGLASLELSVPITPQTVFDIGSTSKQFTAAAIGLLVQDGKLHVADEIHEWLDELPPWDQEVTLDHMLHHTSGMPDYCGLMFDARIDPASVTTPLEALGFLKRVDRLRFAPGSRFEYSNTNFFLLSLVVERAAKQPFQDFVRERFFAPLGMTSTMLFHDHTLVVPHRATGYAPRQPGGSASIQGGGFGVSMSDWEQLGDGAVQTCVEDLVKWDTNFYTHAVGGDALQAFLHATEPLSDGKPSGYARGLFVDTFRGLPREHHGGSWAGYRAELTRFPAQKTSFVCLSNLGDMNPVRLCEQVAAIVLADKLAASK